jgi:hypothetical protein
MKRFIAVLMPLCAIVLQQTPAPGVEVHRPKVMSHFEFSYAHSEDGDLLSGTHASNVVRTSRGRIMAVYLTTRPGEGRTIDGIGVVDLTDPDLSALKISMSDTERKTHTKAKFKCQVWLDDDRQLWVTVWADAQLMDRTKRDAFRVSVDDLYRWRAEKARRGADRATLGSQTYHVIRAHTPDYSGGWAYFHPDDLKRGDDRNVRPRYFVRLVRKEAGKEIVTDGPIPIGDTGYVVVRDRKTGKLVVREGPDAPLSRTVAVPTLPPDRLPEIPEIPDLPDMPDGLESQGGDEPDEPFDSTASDSAKKLLEKVRADNEIAEYTEVIQRTMGGLSRADLSSRRRFDLSSAYSSRAAAYATKEDWDRAIADYEEAIQLSSPTMGKMMKFFLIDAYAARGRKHFSEGDYDKAIADLTKVIQARPDWPRAYGDRGKAYERIGQRVEAEADFAKENEILDKARAEMNRR